MLDLITVNYKDRKLQISKTYSVTVLSRENEALTVKTTQCPWGIQQLVSTHQLPHKSLEEGTSDQLTLKSQVPIPDQIFIGGGGNPDHFKYQVPSSPDQVFIFRVEEGVLQANSSLLVVTTLVSPTNIPN